MFTDSVSFDFNILANDEAFAMIREANLDHIRCCETGQVVGVLAVDSIQKTIEFEVFQNPSLSAEEIVESMQMRWFIQSSRPAPHLTHAKTRDGMLYLRANHPLDVFTMLLGRMLFDSPRYRKTMTEKDARFQKLLWLTDLDSIKHRLVQDHNEAFLEACDALIRIDAIHDVRSCLYDEVMRETADLIRDNPIDLVALMDFVAHVESSAMEALTKMKRTPQGNRMSMSAAASMDIDDEIVTALNDSDADSRQATMRKIQQAQLLARQRSTGTVQVVRGKRAVSHLRDIVGVIPQELADKYKLQAKGAKSGKPAKESGGKSGKQSKTEKALARFAGLNLDF